VTSYPKAKEYQKMKVAGMNLDNENSSEESEEEDSDSDDSDSEGSTVELGKEESQEELEVPYWDEK